MNLVVGVLKIMIGVELLKLEKQQELFHLMIIVYLQSQIKVIHVVKIKISK